MAKQKKKNMFLNFNCLRKMNVKTKLHLIRNLIYKMISVSIYIKIIIDFSKKLLIITESFILYIFLRLKEKVTF